MKAFSGTFTSKGVILVSLMSKKYLVRAVQIIAQIFSPSVEHPNDAGIMWAQLVCTSVSSGYLCSWSWSTFPVRMHRKSSRFRHSFFSHCWSDRPDKLGDAASSSASSCSNKWTRKSGWGVVSVVLPPAALTKKKS